MLNLQQMQEIANTQNAFFFKSSCPFCVSARTLADCLVDKKILDSYSVYFLDKDFNNETLTKLVLNNGWQPDGQQQIASKPQIFIKGEYIKGNAEFYKSKWNTGEGKTNLKNPMRF
jgi:glutaredoxin